MNLSTWCRLLTAQKVPKRQKHVISVPYKPRVALHVAFFKRFSFTSSGDIRVTIRTKHMGKLSGNFGPLLSAAITNGQNSKGLPRTVAHFHNALGKAEEAEGKWEIQQWGFTVQQCGDQSAFRKRTCCKWYISCASKSKQHCIKRLTGKHLLTCFLLGSTLLQWHKTSKWLALSLQPQWIRPMLFDF